MTASRATSLILGILLAGSWAWFLSRPESPARSQSGFRPVARNRPVVLPSTTSTDPDADANLPAINWDANGIDPVSDAGAYARRLLGMPPGEFAGELARLRLERLGRSGFPSGSTTAIGPERDDPMIRMLLTRWGQVDPQAGLSAVAALSDRDTTPAERDRYADLVLEGWIITSPREAWAAALDSVAGLPEAEKRSAAGTRMYALVAALVENGKHDVAAELMRSLPATDSWSTYAQTNFYRPLAMSWSQTDPGAAIAWATRLPNGTGRASAVAGLAQFAANEGPDVATKFVQSFTKEQDIRNAAGGVVTAYGDHNDGAGAYAWLQASIAQGNSAGSFDIGIRNYFSQKGILPVEGMQDAERALLGQIQNASTRSTAATQYVAKRQATMPEEAVQAVVQFYEPARQEAGLATIVRLWAARDYPAAANFVNSSGLIPDTFRGSLQSTAELARKK